MKLSFSHHVVVLMVLLHPGPLSAQEQPAPAGAGAVIDVRRTERTNDAPESWAWTVEPEAPPRPALRYTLLPPPEDLAPGNAAALYRIALLLQPPQDLAELYPGRDIREPQEYLDMPIGEIPLQDAQVHTGGSAMQHLDWAARRDHVDWGWPVREQGLAALFPELNQVREMSRKLRLRARVEIREARYDDALRSLQTTFALARDVADDGVLVNALVGAAIATSATQQVRELTAAPGSPNLYWALADLRRPMFPMGEAMRQEWAILRSSLPLLRDARSEDFSHEKWQRMWQDLLSVMQMASGQRPPLAAGEQMSSFSQQLLAATLTAAAMPRAREHLQAGGMTAAQINALPAAQVVAIYFVEQFRERTDDFDKWTRLPFHVGYPRLQRENDLFSAAQRGEPLNPLLSMLPALDGVWVSLARVDREIAALQTVEAVRAYAAAHDGRLPASLGDITETPAPLDPITGDEFTYERRDNSFVLTAPPIGGRQDRALRYEVTIRTR